LASYAKALRRNAMTNGRKGTDKKKETVRPWLVDIPLEHLR
jgi:hypothetical protein